MVMTAGVSHSEHRNHDRGMAWLALTAYIVRQGSCGHQRVLCIVLAYLVFTTASSVRTESRINWRGVRERVAVHGGSDAVTDCVCESQ